MRKDQNQRLHRSFSLVNLFQRVLPRGFETFEAFACHEQLLATAPTQPRVRSVLLAQRRRRTAPPA
jgi:hypothetical protein